jgi:S1-C subfamily serine protease
MILLRLPVFVALQALTLHSAAEEKTTSLGRQYEAIVAVECSSMEVDYRTPWNPATPGGGSGTAFLIAPNLFLTNAHVVSDASRLEIKKVGDPTPYRARVKFIAHDCDLAVLELVTPAAALSNVTPLPIGNDVPKLDTEVRVIGYPIGGERISVTRGVVSRVDYQGYTHSGVDQHLAIQIDAAINPGNSGGPVVQGDQVVGVAFQGYSGDVAQNTGYMIPVPVIKRFLKDVEDGRYDRYVDLSISHFELVNPAQRKALGLPDDGIGVLIPSVDGAGSAAGVIHPGDVLLAIDGHPVESNGAIDLDGEIVEMAEVVERKFAGDKLRVKLWRERKEIDAELTLKNTAHYLMESNVYEKQPEYIVYAGLVFQPLNSPLMSALSNANLRTRYFYDYFSIDELYKDRPEPVILTNILPDEINTYFREFAGNVVDEINGTKINGLEDAQKALDQAPAGEHVVIKLLGEGRPIALEKKRVTDAQARILTKYGIPAPAFIE